jgi:hypothetical protein
MKKNEVPVRAYFLSSAGEFLPVTLICSGSAPTILSREVCAFSDHGRLPPLQPMGDRFNSDVPQTGSPEDLWPPCAMTQLGRLERWQDAAGGSVPQALLLLRVFKCAQMLLFVIPGLEDDKPNLIDKRKRVLHDQLLRRTFDRWGSFRDP